MGVLVFMLIYAAIGFIVIATILAFESDATLAIMLAFAPAYFMIAGIFMLTRLIVGGILKLVNLILEES